MAKLAKIILASTLCMAATGVIAKDYWCSSSAGCKYSYLTSQGVVNPATTLPQNSYVSTEAGFIVSTSNGWSTNLNSDSKQVPNRNQ